MSERYIGVDVGGTRTKMVHLEAPGTVLEQRAVDSRWACGDDLVARLSAEVQPWLQPVGETAACAMGVAVAGLIDYQAGRIMGAPNLETLEGFAIGPAMVSATGLRIEIDNDANAAGLAEATIGAAAGCSSAVCLTVGTGVGGAIIHNGRLWRGFSGAAGEIGGLRFDEDAQRRLEEDVAAAAIVRRYREEEGGVADADIDAAAVARRADEGDEAARRALAHCGRRLGLALAAVVNVLNPERIVVGGGVAGAGDWFLGPARQEGARRTGRQAWQQCEVVPARLGSYAGAIGAALLCGAQGSDN